jgi:type I restriction-modification system DNA methylase subunit
MDPESTSKKVQTLLVEAITTEGNNLPDLPGWIYQFFMEETEEQAKRGQFYTYPWTGAYLIEKTLKALWEDIKSGRRIFKRVQEIKLLDPSCGCGSLLLRAFDVFYEMYQEEGKISKEEIPFYILKYNLYGIDSDLVACQLATLSLYFKAKEKNPEATIYEFNILCADTLLGRFKPQDPRYYRNPDPGHQTLFLYHYDCVVGNPPYIVINQLKTPPDVVAVYKRYQSATFKINTFALFLERGIAFLAPGGLLSHLVPNTLLTQVYFEALRKHILENTKILEIADSKSLFQNANVENCIISLMKDSQNEDKESHRIQIKTDIENLKNRYHVHTIPQTSFQRAHKAMFNIYLRSEDFKLMDKIEADCRALTEVCESYDGVNPGNIKHKLLSTRKTTRHHKKVLNGKDIWRYGLRWSGLYIWYDRSILEPGDNMRWGYQKALDGKKILTRQTADRIIGTFEVGVYYATNSIHTSILREGINDVDLKYVLALLNSKLLSFYYRKLIPETGQIFSQVKLVHFRRLPIKKASLSVQKEFITLVDRLLTFYQESANRSKNKEEIRQMDALLDQKVYALYGLEKEEIKRVEEDMKGVGV